MLERIESKLTLLVQLHEPVRRTKHPILPTITNTKLLIALVGINTETLSRISITKA